ncbi:MAG: TonB-dependent receptor [Acidobacteriaceae bacterium]
MATLWPTAPSLAQTPDTATLRGQVVDAQNAPIAGAEITATNALTAFQRETRTGANGEFRFAALPIAGAYSVRASQTGFADVQVSSLALSGGGTATLKLSMKVAAGKTQILVTGAVGEVRTDEPQLGEDLGAQQMQEVPLPNRRISFLPLLNAANRPAINQGDIFTNQNLFTTNGSGRRQTWFEVDGSAAVDTWGRQTIVSNIPLAAVEEMTVLENVFAADYGFSTGSVINIVTKSGGSALRGEALGLWRPSGPEAKLSGFTTANATSGNDVTNDTLEQGALTLSGPLPRGARTHFLASGEYSDQDRASPIISPIAPGNFVGRYRGWLALLRLDRQFNDAHTAFFRSNADSFYDTNPDGTVGGNSLPSVGRVFRRRTYSAEIGESAVLSPSAVNNIRLHFALASPITEFDPVVYGTQFSVPVSTGGTFVSGTSQSALLMNRQYEVDETLAISTERNQLRFGATAIHAHNGGDSKEFGGPIYDGQFVYKTCTQPLAVCESPVYLNDITNVQTYTQSYGNARYTVDDTLWALFAQDDYRATPNLTLNLGLRYEQQTFTDGRANLAPRIGFAYNLAGRGTTTLRGGFGLYYAQVVDNSEANYALTGPEGVFNYTAAPGQVGFPASVAAAPLPAFPSEASAPLRSLYIRPGRSSYYDRFFPTSTLNHYPERLQNPYSEQWTLGFERQLAPEWIVSADYVGSHILRVLRPLDVDPPASFIRTAQGQNRTPQAANCTRPYWIWWYSQHGATCNPASPGVAEPPYSVIQSDVNDGVAYYHAFDLNLNHRFSRGASLLASYTWSHTINTVDPDVPSQNPNDPRATGAAERGNALFDQRHRFVLSGVYTGPLQLRMGGVATLASGLPYNLVTGTTNSGDTGATADRPVIDGAVIGRNTGRGTPIYDVSPFVERRFVLGAEWLSANLRAEALNVLNHRNVVGFSGTYGNGSNAGQGFGEPLAGIANQLPARMFQFSASVQF